jgi:hypothetical protein
LLKFGEFGDSFTYNLFQLLTLVNEFCNEKVNHKIEENKHHIHENCAIPYFGDVEKMSCISPHNEMHCPMLLLGPSLFSVSSLVKDFKFNFTFPFFLGLCCFKVREGELMVVIVACLQFCGVVLS